MKIAYIVSHLGHTGVNNVVSDLVTLMRERGHECVVYYFDEHDSPVEYPCKTVRISFWKKGFAFDTYDVVHTHGLKPDLYAFIHKRWSNRTRFISTIHCYVFADFIDLYGAIKGRMLAVLYLMSKLRHDRIVTLSKDAMRYYSHFLPVHKLSYVYNTRNIDTSLVLSNEERCQIETFKGKNILIGMNCVLLYRKGIDIMIEALTMLPDNYKLFVVGNGRHKQTFQNLAMEKGVSDRVCFAGARVNAYRYLPYYDIYALPSRAEGFPLSLLEAAVYGRKTVASDIPTVLECFSNDSLQVFHLKDGAKGLAEAIIKSSTKEQLGHNLKYLFDKVLSPHWFVKRYTEIYKD